MSHRVRSFYHDLHQSADGVSNERLRDIFSREVSRFTGLTRTELTKADRQGTDVFVHRRDRRHLRVDVKLASYDPQVRFGSDDLALEVKSVVEEDKPGWALRDDANTDLVLWLYPTGRYVLLSFRRLRAALRRNLRWWMVRFRQSTSRTVAWGRYYRSLCLFVPSAIVRKAIEALRWS